MPWGGAGAKTAQGAGFCRRPEWVIQRGNRRQPAKGLVPTVVEIRYGDGYEAVEG